MFFMLARKATSKASPTTGTAPIAVSTSVLADHPPQGELRYAELVRLPDDVARDRLPQQVADDRHQPDDGVEAQPDARAGDGEQRIHDAGDSGDAGHGGLDNLVLEALNARLAAGSVGHGVPPGKFASAGRRLLS